MRRLIAPAALLAMLALAGCATAPTAPAKRTTADACGAVTTAWDEFTKLAQTPGRDDAQLVAKRDAMVKTWETAKKGAPAWTAENLSTAIDSMKKFADAGGTMNDQTALYSIASDNVDAIRAQCTKDGNL